MGEKVTWDLGVLQHSPSTASAQKPEQAPFCSLLGGPHGFICSSSGLLLGIYLTPAAHTDPAPAPHTSSFSPPNHPVGGRYSALFIAEKIEAQSKCLAHRFINRHRRGQNLNPDCLAPKCALSSTDLSTVISTSYSYSSIYNRPRMALSTLDGVFTAPP